MPEMRGVGGGVMAIDLAFIQDVETRIKALGWTRQRLAEEAHLSGPTLTRFFNQKTYSPKTRTAIERAVAVHEGQQALSDHMLVADAEHGRYTRDFCEPYFGYFYCYRRSYTNPDIRITGYHFFWDDKRKCMCFSEYNDYSPHSGEVFIDKQIQLVHLLVQFAGAVRLVTLRRIMRAGVDYNMFGFILSQANPHDTEFRPAVSPVVLIKRSDETPVTNFAEFTGKIEPSDPRHPQIEAFLRHAEEKIAFVPSLRARSNEFHPSPAAPVVDKRARRPTRSREVEGEVTQQV